MWVIFGSCFMFFSFYRLSLHERTCVALAHLQCNIHKYLIKKLDFSLFSFDYRKCTFVDSLTEYMGPLNCVQTSMLSLK